MKILSEKFVFVINFGYRALLKNELLDKYNTDSVCIELPALCDQCSDGFSRFTIFVKCKLLTTYVNEHLKNNVSISVQLIYNIFAFSSCWFPIVYAIPNFQSTTNITSSSTGINTSRAGPASTNTSTSCGSHSADLSGCNTNLYLCPDRHVYRNRRAIDTGRR